MVASENELGDVARLARESVVVANAVTLARWIGTCRRPVTAALVLRKADIPAAGAPAGGGGAPPPPPPPPPPAPPPPTAPPAGPPPPPPPRPRRRPRPPRRRTL